MNSKKDRLLWNAIPTNFDVPNPPTTSLLNAFPPHQTLSIQQTLLKPLLPQSFKRKLDDTQTYIANKRQKVITQGEVNVAEIIFIGIGLNFQFFRTTKLPCHFIELVRSRMRLSGDLQDYDERQKMKFKGSKMAQTSSLFWRVFGTFFSKRLA